jgi:phosphate transport system ATP-binding protein
MGSGAVARNGVTGEALLQVRNLSCVYGRRTAVRNVSFDVYQGEILALIGPSGSGKTTLLRALNRLHELTPGGRSEGSIRLGGLLATGRGAFGREELRRRVGYVFQQPNPFPLSVYDNVALPLREHRLVAGDEACTRRVRQLLERVGLLAEVSDRLDESALALSGGQQQRLCLARVLASRPEAILLDEPCSALDPGATALVEHQLVGLRADLAQVIVTHSLAQARRLADRVAFLLDGELVELGEREQIFTAPADSRTRDYVTGRFG